ncbi:MAG: hypothetical protein Q7R56_01815 [Nanoarchaeota archaeon]|nr:hypothetical protein [Nanoarchaeota archaeon]
MNNTKKSPGEAYGFFGCKATKQEIETTLPAIRRLGNVPSALELSLQEDPETLPGDDKLQAIAKEEKEKGCNYVLTARLPGSTHQTTSTELSVILNQAYQSPLYEDHEFFTGNIVFEKDGQYQFLD